MAENENRNMFGLHGISGMLIAVVLLLSILAYLVTNAVTVQAEQADKYYELKGAEKLKMINSGADGSLTPEQAAAVRVNR